MNVVTTCFMNLLVVKSFSEFVLCYCLFVQFLCIIVLSLISGIAFVSLFVESIYESIVACH